MNTTYTVPAVIVQRKALVLALVEEYDFRATAIAARLCERIGETPYSLIEDGHSYATEWFANAAAALAHAETQVDPAVYTAIDEDDEQRTVYVDVQVQSMVDETDRATTTITLEADEPECEDDHAHDWHETSVAGHGGGVIVRERCAHCGKYRITDTWAQRRDTGEQGLHEVSYRNADDESLEWVESLHADA